jgi:hypothetical protein
MTIIDINLNLNTMEIKIDKSVVTQELLKFNMLDKHTVNAIIIMLNNRINLSDSAYTTMSNTDWLIHFRNELVIHNQE